jgi:hypothetical protein
MILWLDELPRSWKARTSTGSAVNAPRPPPKTLEIPGANLIFDALFDSAPLGGRHAVGQLPVGAREVARVAVGVALEVVLVLGLSLPGGARPLNSVISLPGQSREASTSAIVSSAT